MRNRGNEVCASAAPLFHMPVEELRQTACRYQVIPPDGGTGWAVVREHCVFCGCTLETVSFRTERDALLYAALLQRREAAPLREIAELEDGTFAPAGDESWVVAFHDGVPYGEPPAAGEAAVRAAGGETLPVDRAALEFVYPHQAACSAPTKLTATQLKGREKDREIAEDTLQPYARPVFAAPRFLAGKRPVDGAERGTAVHLVMQYVDLSGKTDPGETVADLVRRRLLTEEQAAAVDLTAVGRFLASPLARELREAERVEREYRFSLLVPAAAYCPELDGTDEVLLQGVVDLYAVKDGAVTVVDFKTDRVTEASLPEKLDYYRPQLAAYSGALERMLELPVTRRILYFFHTGQAVEVG